MGTAQHLAAKGTPIVQDVAVAHYGYAGWPYAHYIGKREADSDADILIPGRAPITSVGAFTTYANGAVVPTDTPAVAAATSAHLAARGTPALHTGYLGYAGLPSADTTTLVSVKPTVKLTQLSTSSEELQSPLLEDLPLMLTEL